MSMLLGSEKFNGFVKLTFWFLLIFFAFLSCNDKEPKIEHNPHSVQIELIIKNALTIQIFKIDGNLKTLVKNISGKHEKLEYAIKLNPIDEHPYTLKYEVRVVGLNSNQDIDITGKLFIDEKEAVQATNSNKEFCDIALIARGE